MLELIIADRGDPTLPDPQDPFVQIWRDYDGEVCAYAYYSNGDHWVHLPHTASYCTVKTSSRVVAYPEPFVAPERVIDRFSRVVLPISLHIQGTEVLHASAVLTSNGVAAFCATSETGKSTTAFALATRGYTQWADDAVPFEVHDNVVKALPLPFGIRLLQDARDHLGSSLEENRANTEFKHAEPADFSALFVLKRSNPKEEPEVRVRRLSPTDAFRSILLHAHFFNLNKRDLKKHMVDSYMKLTSIVPVYEVEFPPGFEKLPLLLDEIEQVLKGISIPPLKFE